jgi:hypothetical protein
MTKLFMGLLLITISSFANESDLYNTVVDGQVYKAAIVIEKNGEFTNIAEYQDFFEDQTSVCYTGDYDLAYLIALELQESIWIYDEYELHLIEELKNSIVFSVLDLFSFHDQDADESEKEDFMTYFVASKCDF